MLLGWVLCQKRAGQWRIDGLGSWWWSTSGKERGNENLGLLLWGSPCYSPSAKASVMVLPLNKNHWEKVQELWVGKHTMVFACSKAAGMTELSREVATSTCLVKLATRGIIHMLWQMWHEVQGDKPVSAQHTHTDEQWGTGQGQWRVSSLPSHIFHVTDFWHQLSVFVLNIEAVAVQNWAKEHPFYNCSGCPLKKVDHHKREGISDFMEQCFGFFFCSWYVLLEKQPSAESWWTHFTLRYTQNSCMTTLKEGQPAKWPEASGLLHQHFCAWEMPPKALMPPPLLARDLRVCDDSLLCPALPWSVNCSSSWGQTCGEVF